MNVVVLVVIFIDLIIFVVINLAMAIVVILFSYANFVVQFQAANFTMAILAITMESKLNTRIIPFINYLQLVFLFFTLVSIIFKLLLAINRMVTMLLLFQMQNQNLLTMSPVLIILRVALALSYIIIIILFQAFVVLKETFATFIPFFYLQLLMKST